MDWDTVTSENTPEFSLEGEIVEGKILSVYDGDTVKIAFPFLGNMYLWNCRLSGVDTPELRTSNQKEKEYGYKVRDYLREKILNKVVTVTCEEFDKYGRLLVKVVSEGTNINQWLIDNEYAFAYDGGTKKLWFQ